MKLSSGAAAFAEWIFKGVGAKALTYVVCFFVFSQSMNAITDYMPEFDFNGAFYGLPDAFLWGLGYIDAAGCLQLVIPAYALSFALRRKAVFGG